jgi:hypothetical protein
MEIIRDYDPIRIFVFRVRVWRAKCEIEINGRERRVFIRVFRGEGETEKTRYTRWFNWAVECGTLRVGAREIKGFGKGWAREIGRVFGYGNYVRCPDQSAWGF